MGNRFLPSVRRHRSVSTELAEACIRSMCSARHIPLLLALEFHLAVHIGQQ